MIRLGGRIWLLLGIACVLTTATSTAWGHVSTVDANSGQWQRLEKQIAAKVGKQDAVVISDLQGVALITIHADRLLVPASILKILTALAAFEILGPDYRFTTDFYSSPAGDLKIKGYGDPMQVSEQVAEMAHELAGRIDHVGNLVLDASYFSQPIIIPGRGGSTEPYDAPNGALCVNFNTVAFKRQAGRWISDEPQTPLLPSAIDKIKASGLTSGRITLAATSTEGLQYAGELYRYFLLQAGIRVDGTVTTGEVDPASDKLVWRYESPNDLKQVVRSLLAFSNNFIANQLMLAMGAHVYDAPATLEKGTKVLTEFYRTRLGLTEAHVVEASGISRENRISARCMIDILSRFFPYHTLMRRQDRQWYKTGTLTGIHTRAGYLTRSSGEVLPFVVMVNTPGKDTTSLMRMIEKAVR